MVKKVNKNRYAFAKAALRRASTYWWALSEAMSKAKVARGLWSCAMCFGHFKKNEVQKDHIKPVVSTNGGLNDFNSYVDTLFCEPENIQILCKPCHSVKSATEQSLRATARKEKKATVKEALKCLKELQEADLTFSIDREKSTADVVELKATKKEKKRAEIKQVQKEMQEALDLGEEV